MALLNLVKLHRFQLGTQQINTNQLNRDQGKPLNHTIKHSSDFKDTIHKPHSFSIVVVVKCVYSLTTHCCANCKADLFFVDNVCDMKITQIGHDKTLLDYVVSGKSLCCCHLGINSSNEVTGSLSLFLRL